MNLLTKYYDAEAVQTLAQLFDESDPNLMVNISWARKHAERYAASQLAALQEENRKLREQLENYHNQIIYLEQQLNK